MRMDEIISVSHAEELDERPGAMVLTLKYKDCTQVLSVTRIIIQHTVTTYRFHFSYNCFFLSLVFTIKLPMNRKLLT